MGTSPLHLYPPLLPPAMRNGVQAATAKRGLLNLGAKAVAAVGKRVSDARCCAGRCCPRPGPGSQPAPRTFTFHQGTGRADAALPWVPCLSRALPWGHTRDTDTCPEVSWVL